MNWRHLIDVARNLAGVIDDTPSAPGRPRQMDLRRAVSSAYYAMFHALCRSNAETLIGAAPAMQATEPWVQAYRAMDHRPAKNKLTEYRAKRQVHPDIDSFARTFAILQEQRHDADYDPRKTFTRREVARLIARAGVAAEAFYDVPVQDRRELAAHLLLARNR